MVVFPCETSRLAARRTYLDPKYLYRYKIFGKKTRVLLAESGNARKLRRAPRQDEFGTSTADARN